jgi:hypothetical protein
MSGLGASADCPAPITAGNGDSICEPLINGSPVSVIYSVARCGTTNYSLNDTVLGLTGRCGSLFINEGRVAMSVENLVEHFSTLEDPRCAGKIDHRLIDILVIAVCAVIACAESWDDIALYGRNKAGWLRSFLEPGQVLWCMDISL